MSNSRKHGRRPAAVIVIALLAVGTATTAGAHPNAERWWQYDKATWHHSWHDYPKYRHQYENWRERHQYASTNQERRRRDGMRYQYMSDRFHQAISFQNGEASWYNGDGLRGACGKALVGLYAASRTLPCGALVSVRSGGRYVLVRVLDRGPFGSSSRILDLSPKAFSWLSPLGAGVIYVHAIQLKT
jgi:rare lipoprotein A (peptidoglycan hydrolase)